MATEEKTQITILDLFREYENFNKLTKKLKLLVAFASDKRKFFKNARILKKDKNDQLI